MFKITLWNKCHHFWCFWDCITKHRLALAPVKRKFTVSSPKECRDRWARSQHLVSPLHQPGHQGLPSCKLLCWTRGHLETKNHLFLCFSQAVRKSLLEALLFSFKSQNQNPLPFLSWQREKDNHTPEGYLGLNESSKSTMRAPAWFEESIHCLKAYLVFGF